MATPGPPRVARWILERALPADVRGDISGDLDEVFRRDACTIGAARARRRYWWKTLSFTARFLVERVRDRRSHLRHGDARGWRTRMSMLDFRLGLRMLVRYPGLTLVGGIAMAFAIAMGAGAFAFVMTAVRPAVPLDQGDRLVGIQLWETAVNRAVGQSAYDYLTWRGRLATVDELGAFRITQRNLISPTGHAAAVRAAELTASAMRAAHVSPLLGRTLVEGDEQIGAPDVVVIGFDVWQAQFAGDPAVIGQTARVGRSPATVVGVMPGAFAFPVSEEAWLPLRLVPVTLPRQGPEMRILGRLAPGATIAEAQAELTALGARAALEHPGTHARLQPQVVPYPRLIVNFSLWESVGIMSINVILVLLFVLICGNVALLVFARAATREREIVVRSALGASRGRIVMQLFAEALVLSGIAVVVGLLAARTMLGWALHMIEVETGRLPFWVTADLAPLTVVYAVGLALAGAAIAGVLPALKVTRGLDSQLRQIASDRGLRFGGVWTVVIVLQVAVTVAAPATTFFVHRDEMQVRSVKVGFPAEQYLSARISADVDGESDQPSEAARSEMLVRFESTLRELERRLAAEPAVAGVTVANRLPRMYHPHRLLEVDQGGAAPLDPQWPGYRVSSASIDSDFFDVLRTPILAGRGFRTSGESDRQMVIVNQSFVERVLGHRNPIGRRLRYTHFEEWSSNRPAEPPGPWYEIVGVVPDMGMAVPPDPKVAGIYHPLEPRRALQVHLAVHTRSDPASFAPRLRTLAAEVDPSIRVEGMVPLDKVHTAELEFISFWLRITLIVSVVAMVLSLAGIYAVMSFTVSRRTREIGIRVALGARPARVVFSILRRPIAHVALGVAGGAGLVALLSGGVFRSDFWPSVAAIVLLYAACMMGVCLTACIVPTRRALRVQPTEALKEGG